jgi:choline dehydrogenase-like flavoprotein
MLMHTGYITFDSPLTPCCRLSEVTDWKVLLLEAGGEEPDSADIPAFQPFTTRSHLNWYYESVPDSRFCGGKSCAFTTGKGLGGSSLHNEMMYSRGNRRIFDMWEQMGMFCTVRHISSSCMSFSSSSFLFLSSSFFVSSSVSYPHPPLFFHCCVYQIYLREWTMPNIMFYNESTIATKLYQILI